MPLINATVNITQIQQLGEEWNSDILTSAYTNLSTKTNNANVGSLNGNRMFYNNDYMVNIICPDSWRWLTCYGG